MDTQQTSNAHSEPLSRQSSVTRTVSENDLISNGAQIVDARKLIKSLEKTTWLDDEKRIALRAARRVLRDLLNERKQLRKASQMRLF